MKFSVLIPTYNREKDLDRCLMAVLGQSVLPSEIIIVDDGKLRADFLSETKKLIEGRSVAFVYRQKDHRIERRGLSESKNIGLTLARNDILFIFDDDIVIDDGFFESIMRVWGENPDQNLIGAGGVIKNNRRKTMLEKFYNAIFGLTSSYEWDVNAVGFQVWNDFLKERKKGFYAHGGLSSLKVGPAKQIGFSIFEGGRTSLEDVEFCLKAKNKGFYFMMEPAATAWHNHVISGREDNFLIGFKEGHNRKIIFKNNCRLSAGNYVRFFWANCGWILRQFIALNFLKGLGMIRGLIK